MAEELKPINRLNNINKKLKYTKMRLSAKMGRITLASFMLMIGLSKNFKGVPQKHGKLSDYLRIIITYEVYTVFSYWVDLSMN